MTDIENLEQDTPTQEGYKRRFQRLYLDMSNCSEAEQAHGLPIKLYHKGWLGRYIGSAVLKDISAGGAGIIVPAQHILPEILVVVYEQSLHLKAEVVYSRKISSRLIFIGVKWSDLGSKKLARLITFMQQLSQKDGNITIDKIKEFSNEY